MTGNMSEFKRDTFSAKGFLKRFEINHYFLNSACVDWNIICIHLYIARTLFHFYAVNNFIPTWRTPRSKTAMWLIARRASVVSPIVASLKSGGGELLLGIPVCSMILYSNEITPEKHDHWTWLNCNFYQIANLMRGGAITQHWIWSCCWNNSS